MRRVLGTGRRRVLILSGVGLLIAGTANAAGGGATRDQPPVPDTVVTVGTTAPATTPGTTEPVTTPSADTTVPSTPATTVVAEAATTVATTAATTEPATIATTEPATVAPSEATEPPSIVTTRATRPPTSSGECDPNYAGACVPIDSDVDCSSGKGNGPSYVRGPVQVVGVDIYRLDSDGDGIGCEKG